MASQQELFWYTPSATLPACVHACRTIGLGRGWGSGVTAGGESAKSPRPHRPAARHLRPHTCVFSPSSLKAPMSSVPSSARPSAAEAVGDVL